MRRDGFYHSAFVLQKPNRTLLTLHNLFAKVPKALDNLQTECDSNVFPFH